MKRHRFIGSFNLADSALVVRDGAFFNQCKNVLRLREGEEIILGDGKGHEAHAKIISYGTRSVSVELLEQREVAREVPTLVTLYAAMLKHEHFEFVVQKATEAGVSRIVPVVSLRTVKKGMKRARLEVIMREASEQSGRAHTPVLGDIVTFAQALHAAKESGRIIFFDSSGITLSDLPTANKGSTLALFVGPEGGWNADEVLMARDAGCIITSLGGLVLRAETAATVAVYLGAHGLL
ncbi:MAG: RsmE family RNA methyltransferase [Patescibacteria group bacterium]